ncbi:MAG: FmdB family zinc ribbon protein [Acidobacteriota bacterium]
MPLYEYECDACGHRFEVIQKFSDPPRTSCERCQGSLRKLISSPAIQFKGSGWYVTDYARAGKGEPKDAKSDGSSSEKAAGDASSQDKGQDKTDGSAASTKPATSDTPSAPKTEPKASKTNPPGSS